MAITSGATAANLYYNQPLLAIIAKSLDASTQDTGLIPTLGQIGYALGNFLIVPLSDLLERRRLIVTMLIGTSLALATAAVSPTIAWLIIASFIVGITTIVPQIAVPFAAVLAPPSVRGKVVGIVMSGLLIGIVLSRTVSRFCGYRTRLEGNVLDCQWTYVAFGDLRMENSSQEPASRKIDLPAINSLNVEIGTRACIARSLNCRSDGFWSI
ncbi:MFS transporter [Myxosarcina sp. GI1(2024)]